MSDVGVVIDSTADLPAALQEQFGLAMVPLIVNWDGQTYRDKIDLTTADFYRRLRTSKTLPKTGAPSLAAFEATFPEQLQQHDAGVSGNRAAAPSRAYAKARRAG